MTSVCSASRGAQLMPRRFTWLCYHQLRQLQRRASTLAVASPLLPSRSASASYYSPSRLPRLPLPVRTAHRHPPSTAASATSVTGLPSVSSGAFLVPRRHASIHVTDTTADEFSRQFDRLSDTIQAAVDQPDIEDGDLDLSYSDGVLSIRSRQHGTYVINQHNVTRQVWLSSPISGPSKYNWHRARTAVGRDGRRREGQWCNERDVGKDLMGLLEREFSSVFGKDVKFDEPF